MLLMVRCHKLRTHSISKTSWGSCYLVYLNKVDQVDDKEMIDLVEEEIKELLTSYKFPGDKTQ